MEPSTKTIHGEVRGRVSDGVCGFFGIPFAAPLSDPNRLRPPQPVRPWSGVRDATDYGATPPQVAPPGGAGTDWDSGVTGEEYLNLNVWTPDPHAAGLPVMVWIQGGQFEFSSTSSYDGSSFARDGVVCVVFNWRVGADGFLYLNDGIANLGLLDQVAALEWVRDNIAWFGGDPADVTVFGESAGAMSIGTLLSMPRADGLFRRAILQSGAAHHVSPPGIALRVGHYLAEKLGVPPTRDAIAARPVEELLRAQAEIDAELLAGSIPEQLGPAIVNTMPWEPVLDGDVLPGVPIDRIAAGASADVDLLVGTNVDDWRVFMAFMGAIDQVTDEALAGSVAERGHFALASYGLPADAALTAYRERYPLASPGDLLAAVKTDWWVRIPALRLADAHAAAPAATYMYEFAWAVPGLGAVHAVEVPFVFDQLRKDVPLFQLLLGGTEAPQALADTMHGAWVSFAASGDPGWPRYDLARRATMRFDVTPEVVDDPRSWERNVWRGIR
ncbi:carboxylesterase/lipase family protein [Nocardioides iriomotensis]|uniref:Carboxylic ester hydrolase n=1 Tax=Nocardioides iriomotensis TaxID=715784 RepID=A0A4Q5IVJ9_9ACTN|nr:carboxylesterase family protein [Nocardioides iriomotensis]RYU09853.1 carboxylesterase/lipase family protein [Nocardioides iriomotensis]